MAISASAQGAEHRHQRQGLFFVGLTQDQIQFKETVARFLADKSPVSSVRTLMATERGVDPDIWARLTRELGAAGVHIPEAYGGSGFGPVELGIGCEEMGRSLFCGPFLASAVMAACALVNEGTEAEKEALLPGIADGSRIGALVLDDLNSPDALGQSVSVHNGQLSGVAEIVIDGANADILIVAAGTPDGVRLHQVDPDAAGLTISPLETLDPTRKLARLQFENVAGRQLGERPMDVEKLWDQMSTMLAHEMIGGAAVLFESTIEYMKMRVQFGRAIGSFQALKHRCADLLLELELAKSAVQAASAHLADGSGYQHAPNNAKALAGDAYMSIARQAIQLRGGIGFTWEEDAQLWFKRAKSSEVLFGSPNWHREKMIQRLQAQEVQNVG
jgi:alkylation response protein AidB-like acyl-CoA dehydrogenase